MSELLFDSLSRRGQRAFLFIFFKGNAGRGKRGEREHERNLLLFLLLLLTLVSELQLSFAVVPPGARSRKLSSTKTTASCSWRHAKRSQPKQGHRKPTQNKATSKNISQRRRICDEDGETLEMLEKYIVCIVVDYFLRERLE
jgi:hypothetical protein